MKRSHMSKPVSESLEKQNPEIRRRISDEASRAPSREGLHGPQVRVGTEAEIIPKPVKRIKS
jgi:hypothetical protein